MNWCVDSLAKDWVIGCVLAQIRTSHRRPRPIAGPASCGRHQRGQRDHPRLGRVRGDGSGQGSVGRQDLCLLSVDRDALGEAGHGSRRRETLCAVRFAKTYTLIIIPLLGVSTCAHV